MTNPKIVVFIPGTTGTDLIDKQDELPIWPDQVLALLQADKPELALNLLNGFDPAALANIEHPDSPTVKRPVLASSPSGWDSNTKPMPDDWTEIDSSFCDTGSPSADNALGYGITASFFNNISSYISESNQNFQLALSSDGNPNTAALPDLNGGNLLIGWGYDWRNDNTQSAIDLATLVAGIYNRYSSDNPDFELHLLCHSMGGLVARGYLENPSNYNAEGYTNIKTLITLGTPHLGAPMALQAIMNEDLTNLSARTGPAFTMMAHDFVNFTNGVSTYQLLPPAVAGFTDEVSQFILDGDAAYDIKSMPADVRSFINAVAAKAASNTTDIESDPMEADGNLGAAINFFDGLQYTSVNSNVPHYFCLYGVVSDDPCTLANSTCTQFNVARDSNNNVTGVEDESVQGAGDHIVPTKSAQFISRDPSKTTTYEITGVDHLGMGMKYESLIRVAQILGYQPIPVQ